MKTLSFCIYLLFIFISHSMQAQTLTTPQVAGYPAGKTITIMSLPLSLKGLSFKQISNSVWYPEKSKIVAEMWIQYYREGDNTKYANKTTKETFVDNNGNWSINGITVEPIPYPVPNKKVLNAVYSIFVWQEYNGQQSARWNESVVIKKYNVSVEANKETIKKIPKQYTPPVKVKPIDKHAQAVPPQNSQTIKK